MERLTQIVAGSGQEAGLGEVGLFGVRLCLLRVRFLNLQLCDQVRILEADLHRLADALVLDSAKREQDRHVEQGRNSERHVLRAAQSQEPQEQEPEDGHHERAQRGRVVGVARDGRRP